MTVTGGDTMQAVKRLRKFEGRAATPHLLLPLALMFLAGCQEPEEPQVSGINVPGPNEGGAGGTDITEGMAGSDDAGTGGTVVDPVTGAAGSGGDVGTGGTAGAGGAAGTGGTTPQPVMIFDETKVHDVQLTMLPEDWRSIIDDSRGEEWRLATFTYDGVTMENVGVRPSGESSRFAGNVKMSVRIKFDAFTGTGKFGGFEEIKLGGMFDDPSLLRERLAYYLYRQVMPSPREVHGRLTVNGESRGLYSVEEVWDDEAIKDRFVSPIGPLYRIRGLPGMDPYLFRGMDPALYVPLPWDPKGNRPFEDHVVIGSFLKGLADGVAAFDQVVDVENLLAFFAASTIVTNTDGFNGSDVEDHYQYYDPSTGKFLVLPWDPDNTFGSLNDPPQRDIFERFGNSVLSIAVRDDPGLRARYKAKLTEVMTKVPLAALHAEAERVYQQIKQAAYEDTLKLSNNGHFDFSLSYIKDFAAARYASIQEQVMNGP